MKGEESPMKRHCNRFVYTVRDEFGGERTERGSYYSRGPVSKRVLADFVQAGLRRYLPLSRLVSLDYTHPG